MRARRGQIVRVKRRERKRERRYYEEEMGEGEMMMK